MGATLRSEAFPMADACRTQQLFALRALALEFPVEFAFGLAELAGKTLERFFLVKTGFGLKAGDFCRDTFASQRIHSPVT
jgi:hypothetical protein